MPPPDPLATTSSIPAVPHIEPVATSVSLPRFRSTIERLSATDTFAKKVISFTGAPGLDVTKSDLRRGVCYTR